MNKTIIPRVTILRLLHPHPMITICSILLVLAGLTAGAQTSSPSQPLTATIDAAKTGPPILPYVYGQFLEHAGSLIYSSLWSEMLDDRKFYYDVTNRVAEDPNAGQRGFGGFGPGRRRNVGPGRWNPIGPVDSVMMDTNNPFVGDHTPLIQLAGSDPRGIRQTGVNFVKGETYEGRIQLTGDSNARVSVSVVWGTNAGAAHPIVVGGSKLDPDLLRLCVGLEPVEEIMAALGEALA